MIKLGDFGISKVLDGTLDMAKTVGARKALIKALFGRSYNMCWMSACGSGDRDTVLHESGAV